MDKEDLRNEILEAFGEKLKLLNADIKIIETDESSDKIIKKHGPIKFLGYIRQRAVFILTISAALITIFIGIPELPDAIEKYKPLFPKTIEYAREYINKVNNLVAYDPSEDYNSSYGDNIIIVKSKWAKDQDLYDKDKFNFMTNNIPDIITSGTTLITSGLLGFPPDDHTITLCDEETDLS